MNPFNEEYYMNGIAAGVSNYENYTWMEEPTMRCCEQMATYLNMQPRDSVLDYGCARGYYVKALRALGYEATGYDISEWAIRNCDERVRPFVFNHTGEIVSVDWIIAKDVLEHIPRSQIATVVRLLMSYAQRGVLIIVPLSNGGTNEYVNPRDNADSTHELCWTLDDWICYLQRQIDKGSFSYTVAGGYRVPGVKDNAASFPKSTGFITLRRYG